ncbi:MAG: FtsW/RodA/SpoVE family cell cycle protein [Planctomycetota bacterium]
MLRSGHAVILCAFALLTIGVVMVSSAGMAVSPIQIGPAGEVSAEPPVTASGVIFSRPTAYMTLAIGAMLAMSLLPVRRLAASALAPAARRPLLFLALGTLGLLGVLASVYLPGISREINGAHRWVNLRLPGLESVQPSEIAKWGIIPLLALFAALPTQDGSPRLARPLAGLLPALAALGAVSGMIVLEDLGTGVLIASAGTAVLVAGGARVWHLAPAIPLAAIAFYQAVATSEYRLRRILAFIDPFADPRGDGYHMIQSMATVAGGGLTGRGLGHGLQKFDYLPEDTTDFLFAVICEELGLAGATLVIALLAMLILVGAGIALRERSGVLKLCALGIVATLAFQALINLVVVTGMGPTKGIALPLLSAGGTGWILTAASLGVLVAIDRAHAREEADEPADEPAAESSADEARRAPEVIEIPGFIEPKPNRKPGLRPQTKPAPAIATARALADTRRAHAAALLTALIDHKRAETKAHDDAERPLVVTGSLFTSKPVVRLRPATRTPTSLTTDPDQQVSPDRDEQPGLFDQAEPHRAAG